MAPRTREHRPDRVATALAAQWTRVAERVATIDDDELTRDTVTPGRRIVDLLLHLAHTARVLETALAEPEPRARAVKPSRDAVSWVRADHAVLDHPERTDHTDHADRPEHVATDVEGAIPDVRTGISRAFAAARAAIEATGWPTHAPRRLVHLPGMSDDAVSTVTDLAVSRVVEAVVHADDLARSLGGSTFAHDRDALAITVRLLADTLATSVPGHSVELRVPPYAAVQCVPGPRHTRGTPPSVVQTDPVTWTRLATGRLTWADALAGGGLAASGERSDLGPHLPLIR